jgi:hypothetical protein
MTRDDWFYREHRIGWLRTLCAAYEAEHDFDTDEDVCATYEMLVEVRAIHSDLLAAMGEPPAPEAVGTHDPSIPF